MTIILDSVRSKTGCDCRSLSFSESPTLVTVTHEGASKAIKPEAAKWQDEPWLSYLMDWVREQHA